MVNLSTNIVDDVCVWDGNTDTWQPPENYLLLDDEATPALTWVLSEDQLSASLQPVLGAGAIGFIWDGNQLKTNEPNPISE